MPGHEINSEFRCHGDAFSTTEEMKKAFDENGYIIVRGFLDGEELGLLRTAVEQDAGITDNRVLRNDGEGRTSTSCIWTQPSDTVTGTVMRSEKVACTWEQLLGGEVYIYDIKVTMKEPYTGGAFVWHQDYGYYYKDGCVLPDMGTVFIAIDKATQENGCLKILKGSHKMGRLDTKAVGEQLGADPERVKLAVKRFELVYAELEAGDAMFFHCNILHRSEQNHSPHRRWGFLGDFNRADNSPQYTRCPSAVYSHLEKVPNSAIKSAATTPAARSYFNRAQLVEFASESLAAH